MKRTVFQHPELRDANDNIIQQGAFGKNTALANSTNDGWIDYVANDLEALYDNINGARIYVASKAKLPATGDLSAMYIAEDTGKWYLWDGTKYIETDNARKIADEAIAARDAAKASANDAANSAREQQADWNVTDTTNQAFIKNKPAVYPRAKTLEIEDTRAQINTPSFFINNYNRRIKSDFKREDSPEAETFSSFITITPWDNNTGGYPSQLAFTERGNIFYRIGSSDEKWGNWKRIPLEGETIDFNKPVKENGGFLVPIGVVQAFAGSTIPTGWLLCDGSAVSRTDYAALFAVIGTTYGAGNGSSTFNLPNLVDKFVEGSATAGTVKSAGLPNITGTLLGSGSYSINNPSYFTGAFAYTNAVKSKTFGSDEKNEKWNSAADFNASRSSAIYGASDTVQPPALTMRYIIKY